VYTAEIQRPLQNFQKDKKDRQVCHIPTHSGRFWFVSKRNMILLLSSDTLRPWYDFTWDGAVLR